MDELDRLSTTQRSMDERLRNVENAIAASKDVTFWLKCATGSTALCGLSVLLAALFMVSLSTSITKAQDDIRADRVALSTTLSELNIWRGEVNQKLHNLFEKMADKAK